MAVVGVADQYMIMMSICLVFTVLAIAYRESLLLRLLAGVSWIISALAHFAVGDQTSILTSVLSLLFAALGLILIANTVISATSMLGEKRFRPGFE